MPRDCYTDVTNDQGLTTVAIG